MAIVFKSLRLNRWFDGSLVGEIAVEGDNGKIELKLTEELCSTILNLCADRLVDAAQEVAVEFRRESMMIQGEIVEKIEQGVK